jgi:hypothetical protein
MENKDREIELLPIQITKNAIKAAVDQYNKFLKNKKKKKTIHELCKANPDKSYKELELELRKEEKE